MQCWLSPFCPPWLVLTLLSDCGVNVAPARRAQTERVRHPQRAVSSDLQMWEPHEEMSARRFIWESIAGRRTDTHETGESLSHPCRSSSPLDPGGEYLHVSSACCLKCSFLHVPEFLSLDFSPK